MAATIDTAFVNQFKANIELLHQQKGSKLEDCVRVEMQNGEYAYYDQMSKQTSLTTSPARNASTAFIDSPYSRRRVGLTSYKYAELIDEFDTVRMLVDPSSTIAQNIAYLFGRTKDSVIITAANATAYTGKEGGTSTTFSGAMVIPASGTVGVDTNAEWCGDTTGLNLAKLRGASYLLDMNDVDEEDRFLIAHPFHKAQMLAITEVASRDYNTDLVLTNGQVDSFMGFKFVWTTQATANTIFCWHKQAMLLSIGEGDAGLTAEIERDMTHNYSTQVFMSASYGASRMDEDAVVQINCS